MLPRLADDVSRSYAFGPFTLFPERQQLLEAGTPVRIGGRAFDILTMLVERQGDVVGKTELLARVWPNVVVEEGNLKVHLAALRRVLGEGSDPPKYIATVTGRGYKFIAPVQASAADVSPVPRDAPPARNHNLPTSITRVVGRADSIASIDQALESARLVSIVGTGGVGKTTVAMEVAAQALGRFEDGVWLVDLVPLKDPSLVPNAIATVIGLTAHSANMLAALCGALQDRTMLLVLDNCEHLVESVASVVQRILTSTENVKILATTREPLCVKGERVRRLSGLTTPPISASLTAEAALAFPAVQLFVERAKDRLASFNLSDADAATVAAICRKLDGVALAIELAATRVDAFGVGELLQRLDGRFRLLQGHRASTERHRTLTAMIDWSYELLSDDQRAILRRLAIFAGTFGLSGASAVVADEHIDRLTVIDELGNLVSKSLVTVEAFESEVEYRLLDTTRSYAFEKLANSSEFEHIRVKHADYCLDLAQRAKAEGATLLSAQWLERYRPKIDDIRDALGRAFAGGADPLLGVKLTVAAIPYWERLSLLEECRIAVERALDERFCACRTERDELILHLSLGATLLFTRGPLPEVKSVLTRALEIAETIGDLDLQLECLRGLSQHDLWAGDSRSSLAISERIRALGAEHGDAVASNDAEGQAGSALHYLGALHAARAHLESFLAAPPPKSAASDFSRFEFDQRLEARGSLAMVVWLLGFPEKALEIANQQLEEAEASQFAVPYCAAVLLTSTCITLYVGNFQETERSLDVIEDYATEHGLTLWKAMAACMRVKLHIDMHRPVDMVAYGDVLEEVRVGGFGLRYPPFLGNYGHLLSRQGDHDGALEKINQAISLYAGSGQDWGIPEMLTMKGNFIRAGKRDGWLDAATRCYVESIALARQHGTLTWELRSATQLVEMWREAGGNKQAEEYLSSAYGRFEEGFWTADLRRALSLLQSAPSMPL